jgi:hypothetical protein
MSLALLRCLATPVSTTFSDFPVLLVDEIGTLQIQEALYSLLDIFRMYLEFEGGSKFHSNLLAVTLLGKY